MCCSAGLRGGVRLRDRVGCGGMRCCGFVAAVGKVAALEADDIPRSRMGGGVGACGVGACGGVCAGACGSGSSSDDEDDDEEDDEDDDPSSPCGMCLPYGSSPVACLGLCGRCCWGLAGRGSSSGGGPSVCMNLAVRCSAAVGVAPKSTYREPVVSLWLIAPESTKMSYVLVSSGVAILKCSGAVRMRVPTWLSHATMGAPLWPFSTAMIFAGPRYPWSAVRLPRRM